MNIIAFEEFLRSRLVQIAWEVIGASKALGKPLERTLSESVFAVYDCSSSAVRAVLVEANPARFSGREDADWPEFVIRVMPREDMAHCGFAGRDLQPHRKGAVILLTMADDPDGSGHVVSGIKSFELNQIWAADKTA